MNNSYEYNIKMSCGGCASTVRKAVEALPNIQFIETSVPEQKVTVVAGEGLTFDQVKDAIVNAGKQVTGGRTL